MNEEIAKYYLENLYKDKYHSIEVGNIGLYGNIDKIRRGRGHDGYHISYKFSRIIDGKKCEGRGMSTINVSYEDINKIIRNYKLEKLFDI